ncbi:HEPN family nuclease [Thauera butanivorans]|uniref:HEPN family nuclease n=1 Tax=Thauera butanivorans TaxID=86174 RepID=UPI000B1A7FC1|nr:HEPN family nuclease [Thauera butanivorans]
MTAYTNLVSDFPKRCLRLLDTVEDICKKNNLDVTLLLNVASSGLVIPMERLSSSHPSDDRNVLPKCAQKYLNQTLGRPFIQSSLASDSKEEWKFGEATLASWNTDPDGWAMSALTSQPTNEVISIIRNSLAHGNIHARGKPEIQEIIFSSKKRKSLQLPCGCKEMQDVGMKYVSATPKAFTRFLREWFSFLDKQPAVECCTSL